MRMPPFERYLEGLRLLGVFLIGAIVGAIVLNALFAAQFEAFYMTRNELENKLEQYELEIKSLNQYKNQHTVIKTIQLRIAENEDQKSRATLDKVTQAELIKRVKSDLSIFIGQSIFDIDSDAKFARRLLERKVYTDVSGKDYRVELSTVLLVDNALQIWMTVLPYAKPPAT
ncbi:hypothetical protein [Paenibacillus sp. HB172176]|uniref:hypothetical protein n=1 Tax=Paenibacillus sp. HB172176 TaxID=2493690 RepID=UPI0014398D35|nr:hypothetical protein [Paenibacillus sp. HB172176]